MSTSALRSACAEVAARARQVRVDTSRVMSYAEELARERSPAGAPDTAPAGDPETRAAFWLTLDAINFGSGWFPTLRKMPGTTGYRTIADGVCRRFADRGAWRAAELAEITAPEIAGWVHQDPAHPLMSLFAGSLNDLGARLLREHHGSFLSLANADGGSACALAERLGGWPCFADTARYQELELPFRKRAQIAAADLHRAGVIAAPDLGGLTMFADNLVPHVLRLDGILCFAPGLVSRIEAEALLEAGSPEEVEIRACAVHAVELIVTVTPGATAAELDGALWERGQGRRYKSVPRHRCRCTAY